MIIHCTKKLAAKLPSTSPLAPPSASPLGNWHANLYLFDRRNCLLFCHDETRYTLFLPGLTKPQFAELDGWFKELFTASLAYLGMPDSRVRRAELALGKIAFDTATDRSVLGSLNRMHIMVNARVCEVENVMLLNPLSVNKWLCHYPVERGSDFWMADEAMMELVNNL